MTRQRSAQLVFSCIALLLVAGLAISGCGSIEDALGDRDAPTHTARPDTNGNPGGRLSVWLETPDGQVRNADAPIVQGAVPATPVGPNATETAVAQTQLNATATAAALQQPEFIRPPECPEVDGVNPPPQPTNFADFGGVIAEYLSDGVKATPLRERLASWGAITDQGGLVNKGVDLTGDGARDVVITLFNPYTYDPDAIRNEGQLLIYTCEYDGYQLQYREPINASARIALPQVLRVGDMNGDVSNEVVYFYETCNGFTCDKEAHILSYDRREGFVPLNTFPITARNGRISILDLDNDYVWEVEAEINIQGGLSVGPPRSLTEWWDWDGENYNLVQREELEGQYRIFAMYEADDLVAAGQYAAAVTAYADARLDDSLLDWDEIQNEREILRAYGAFRIIVTYTRLGNTGRAEYWVGVIQDQNPPGSVGYGYVQMAEAFWNTYTASGGDITQACAQANTVGDRAPNVLSTLNSYSPDRRFLASDLCPF
ncbi:MAG: hypothetical protein GYB65_21800 [Chloroflexi bacterium]|nr:hypothetical protein [Chloroflexota bacterium]